MQRARAGGDAGRRGFTLIELLVVMVIVLTLAALAIATLQPNDSSRLNQAATLTQQQIMLAKNSATSERAIRGIRFERDANDPRICRSLSMIGSAGLHKESLSDIRQISGDPSTHNDDYWQISGAFDRLGDRNLLAVGTHVEIPAASGQWYYLTDRNFDPTNGDLSISGHYQMSKWGDDTTQPQAGEYIVTHEWDESVGLLGNGIQCNIELAPTVMSAADPLVLPQGTAIDLDASQVPVEWRNSANYCDLLFTSEGSTGATGLVHLYVTRLADIELTRNLFPDHPANGGTRSLPIVPAIPQKVPAVEPYLVTVMKNTGTVVTSNVDFTDADADNQADKPFEYGRKGQQAK